MSLAKRILTATFTFPPTVGSSTATKTLTLDASVDMKVRVSKSVFPVQQAAEISVTNLSHSLREWLLSHITAFNKRQVNSGEVGTFDANGNPINPAYVGVRIQAGYEAAQDVTSAQIARQGVASRVNTTTIFSGFVVQCDPVGAFPNLAVVMKAYNRAADNSTFVANLFPGSCTFKTFCAAVATVMGLQLDCSTSYDDRTITNPGASAYTVNALLLDIQSLFSPDVVAWVDGQTLYVRDRAKMINPGSVPIVAEFVGNPPSFTDYGCAFTTLMDPRIQIGSGVELHAILNPALGTAKNPKQYVVVQMDYALASRENEFYVTVHCCPPA